MKINEALKRKASAVSLLSSPHFFTHFVDAVRRAGLVGEAQNALVIYVFGISRLLRHPLNIFVKGPSSSGKNFLVKSVLRFFPQTSVEEMTSGTGTSWNYQGRNLQHKIVYVQEENKGAGNLHPARLLISENELIRMVTVREGRTFKTVREVTKGPVACITTTTKDRLEVDDETRHLSIWTDDSPEQTKRILEAHLNPTAGIDDDELAAWHEVQRLLRARAKLPIESSEWVRQVVQDVWTGNVRVRRYFPAFLEACKVVCMIRSFRFDQDEIGAAGKLRVDFTDFAIASLIFNSSLRQSLSYAHDDDRQVHEALNRIVKQKNGTGVEAKDLARELGISTDHAYARLREAVKSGTVRLANRPTKGNRKLYVAEGQTEMLPDPKEVFQKLGSNRSAVKFNDPITGKVVEYRR